MSPVRPLLFLLSCVPLAAQAAGPKVELQVDILPHAALCTVRGPAPSFVGVVLASLDPQLQPAMAGLPPLLAAPVVLGAALATADAGAEVKVPLRIVPRGIRVHVQGVALGDLGIGASNPSWIKVDAPL